MHVDVRGPLNWSPCAGRDPREEKSSDQVQILEKKNLESSRKKGWKKDQGKWILSPGKCEEADGPWEIWPLTLVPRLSGPCASVHRWEGRLGAVRRDV